MVSVTGTLTAVPPVGVMITLPVKVPVDKALVFTSTFKVAGVVPLAEVAYAVADVLTTIQFTPLVVDVVAWKPTPLAPAALATERYCGVTTAPGVEELKLSVGEVDVPPFAVTVTLPLARMAPPIAMVTWTDCVLPLAVSEMVPL